MRRCRCRSPASCPCAHDRARAGEEAGPVAHDAREGRFPDEPLSAWRGSSAPDLRAPGRTAAAARPRRRRPGGALDDRRPRPGAAQSAARARSRCSAAAAEAPDRCLPRACTPLRRRPGVRQDAGAAGGTAAPEGPQAPCCAGAARVTASASWRERTRRALGATGAWSAPGRGGTAARSGCSSHGTVAPVTPRPTDASPTAPPRCSGRAGRRATVWPSSRSSRINGGPVSRPCTPGHGEQALGFCLSEACGPPARGRRTTWRRTSSRWTRPASTRLG